MYKMFNTILPASNTLDTFEANLPIGAVCGHKFVSNQQLLYKQCDTYAQ